METQGQPMFGVNGWLPNGMKVFYNIPVRSPLTAFEEALAFTNALLALGFTQTEPGLGRGEHTELIGLVSRRAKTNKDGSTSTVLDLYAAAQHLTYRYMAVYLDTPEDIAAFESASGLKLNQVPLNLADSAPSKDNTRLVVSPVKPLTVVYTNNPDYDETSDAKKPKRLFVRWEAIAPNGASSNPQNAANANVGANNGNSQIDLDAWDKVAAECLEHDFAGKLNRTQLLMALDVQQYGEWKRGRKAAYDAATNFLKSVGEPF